MNRLLLIISILITISILILSLIRLRLYNKFMKVKKIGLPNYQDVNLLYDDYYENSNSKQNHKLNCNIGVFRKTALSSHFQYEIDFLNLKNTNKKYKVLVVSTIDLRLEIELVKRFPEIEIIAFSNNLFNSKILKEKVAHLPQITVAYSNPMDISKEFKQSDYLFDRIIIRECLGNISKRKEFLDSLKPLLNKKGFIYLKTFVFQPIFEKKYNEKHNVYYHQVFSKQKMLIDYWNYNFSTSQSIINDLIENYQVSYEETNLLNLFYLYNMKDFTRVLKLYFLDMGFNVSNLTEWSAISSLKVLVLKVS